MGKRDAQNPLVRRHLRFGWWALAVFATFGLALEGLLGFKIGWYVDVSSETRRLLWTLAHAHGVLLALVNVAFAGTLALDSADASSQRTTWASMCLCAATILLPGGFFLGGTFPYGGDPGLGILLVPIGAVLLLAAIYLTAVRA